jgi:N-methylhydantoinase B
VLDDVLSGFVSPEAAERDYGVRIADRAVDEEATSQLRAGRPLRSAASGHAFDFGPERAEWDTVFTGDRMRALNDELMTRPISLRQGLRQNIFRQAAPALFEADARAARRVLPDQARAAKLLDAAIAELAKSHAVTAA